MYKQLLKIISRITVLRSIVSLLFKKGRSKMSREVFGLKFINPIGVGAGFDRDADMFNALSDFGYSFVDVGPMNDKKILSAINNMKKGHPKSLVLSIDISKDHEKTFSLAYDFADMFVIDAPDSIITDVLTGILDTRLTYESYKPILVKISHDMPQDELEELLNFCLMNGVDGAVVAKAENVAKVNKITLGRFPIIGYGGIRNLKAAKEMLDAGASLIEITTGMLLDGPSTGARILRKL